MGRLELSLELRRVFYQRCHLDSAKIPSRLEPNCIVRSDARKASRWCFTHSMGVWSNGGLDVTCPDTFAPSHELS